MRIIRSTLPSTRSSAWVVLTTLGDSFYFNGLHARDIYEVSTIPEKEVKALLPYLEAQGLVQVKNESKVPALTTYELTNRCKELLNDRNDA